MHPQITDPQPGSHGGPHGKMRRLYWAAISSSVVTGVLFSPVAEAVARVRMHAR